MQVYIEDMMPATPIKVSMSYSEALNILHTLNNCVQGNGYPTADKLKEQLQIVVDDPYFD